MTGFTFKLGDKDVFVVTNRKNKTRNLARSILQKPQLTDGRADELLYWLQKAECEIHALPNGRQYYEIHGNNFGGKGSFVDDGLTIIVNL